MKITGVISLLSLGTFALAKDSSTTTSYSITDAYAIFNPLLPLN
jgi:hypothetical protein